MNTKHFKKLSLMLSIILTLGTVNALSQEGPAAAPKFLYHTDPAHSAGQVADVHNTISVTPRDGGLDVVIRGSEEGYPGFAIRPSDGAVWDLSPWGHIAAKITNTGSANLWLSLRVDNDGPWQDNPWNTESVSVPPGQSRVVKVIFGHQYGFKPGYKLDPSKVIRVLFFGGKSAQERSFRIEDLLAGGATGEKPPVDPNAIVVRPPEGFILGAGAKLDPQAQFSTVNTQAADWTARNTLELIAEGGKNAAVTVKPVHGVWHLGEWHEVKLTLHNTGETAVKPGLRLESRGGAGDTIALEEPLAAGARTTITASFAPAKPWQGIPNPKPGHGGGIAGTGTRFESNRANGVTLLLTEPEAGAKVEITEIRATATPAAIPEWLGKRPPVEGDWKLTFEDNFDGDTIDLQSWNIYTSNFWDKRTHFTRDNAIVSDGNLILRYEKKTGFHNDDPDDRSPVAKTDFACGFADTYGKWTQRYGYFEARMKLPTCPGLWPAFWMMPDRGGDPDHSVNPQWKRASTHSGGMEFDIMEHLTAWGPYRFNVALHWDGYQKEHAAVGTSNIYVPTDAEGYFTIGLLWTPGEAVFYGNGREVGRWESERICDVQSYMILYMVSGGWANSPLDESQLPDDFVIDYVRAWQRQDLATAADGAKPNDGAPKSQF